MKSHKSCGFKYGTREVMCLQFDSKFEQESPDLVQRLLATPKIGKKGLVGLHRGGSRFGASR